MNTWPTPVAVSVGYAQRAAAFNAQSFLDSAGLSKRIETYSRNDMIFSQGDRSDGHVRPDRGVKLSVLSKSGREAIVAMLGPGDFFGEGFHA